MSYEVTATRRRPQSFDALVGQEFVVETFKNSIQSKKIAHAYLFSGPRGCGKTSTARILAKALNCVEGPTSTPCNHCQQCTEITGGTCTDVIEIDGASNTSVNDIRQIKDEILFPPQSCRYKIYIIDEVHMLSTSAFNALLKTIEEPPPYVIFIFATTELQKVPATIKSRCQQFNFRLVPVEKVKEQLSLAAEEIGIKAQDEALYWIAKESTGSMRDAYTLFDQVASFSGDEITYEKIRDKLGLVGVDRLNEIFEACAAQDSQTAIEKLDSFFQSGISIEQLISNSADYLRSLLLIKTGIKKESLLGNSAERYSQKVLDTWNSVQLERAISIFFQLYRDIRYSLNPRYEVELAFSRLSWLSKYVSPAEVKSALDKTKSLLLDGGTQQSEPEAQTQNQRPAEQRNFFNSFSSGGAEPPHQSADFSDAAAADSNDYEEYSYAPDGSSPAEEDSFRAENISSAKDAAKLKEIILNDFLTKDETAILGTILKKTGGWNLSENKIATSVASEFDAVQIRNNIGKINSALKQYSGEALTFSVSVQQNQKRKEEVFPQSVQLICSVFSGQVISKGEKIGEKAPEAPQIKTQDSGDNDDIENSDEFTMEEEDESL